MTPVLVLRGSSVASCAVEAAKISSDFLVETVFIGVVGIVRALYGYLEIGTLAYTSVQYYYYSSVRYMYPEFLGLRVYVLVPVRNIY